MKGIKTQKSKVRSMIFTEIARLAYEGGGKHQLEELPFKIIPGEEGSYRESVFIERAVVGQRLRVAMGLSLLPASVNSPISAGMDESMIDEKYYEPPLIDIIKYACHKCPEKRVFITDGCQGCFEHPCVEVCPKKAITLKNGRSVIDQSLCIKCGKCVNACPYNAIIKQDRPCASVCGTGAIKTDEYGRASIDYKKCVSCGQCLVHCPFGAIVDKSQIYQTIKAMMDGQKVYAIIAPSIAGQYGPDLTDDKVENAFKALGFAGVVEVASGADLCTIQEATDFLREVPEEIPFMGTSCCPAWAKMVKNEFPAQAKNISMALTPMVFTARLKKLEEPDCKVAFIGPCAAKKLEASRNDVKSYVDFVLTYEEVQGMFKAKDIDFKAIEPGRKLDKSSGDGRGFATGGGVAKAVVKYINSIEPELEVKVASAEGLADCRKLMLMAKAGKYNGYLLEGMACPGGCIGGVGTIIDLNKAKKELDSSIKNAAFEKCSETLYEGELKNIENIDMTENKVDSIKEWSNK